MKLLSHVRLFVTHEPQPTRLLCPWDSPGKSTGVGCHFLLQGIFPTQGSNLGLPHCTQMLYRLSHQHGLKTSNCKIQQKNYTTFKQIILQIGKRKIEGLFLTFQLSILTIWPGIKRLLNLSQVWEDSRSLLRHLILNSFYMFLYIKCTYSNTVKIKMPIQEFQNY